MSVRTVVATANVQCDLDDAAAADCLRAVLDLGPDLVGLQEWGRSRRGLLRDHPAYRWWTPLLGGTTVGVRRERYVEVAFGARLLGGLSRGERDDVLLGLEPPRVASVATARDRRDGRRVALVCFHLAPGVQQGGRYRADRPRLVSRHQRERARLEHVVAAQLAERRETTAVGDGNFDGLALAGLTSAWTGRDAPGTLGRRSVDDVHGPGPALDVRLVATASDHRALVVTRERAARP